jgi:hypothetical protein
MDESLLAERVKDRPSRDDSCEGIRSDVLELNIHQFRHPYS